MYPAGFGLGQGHDNADKCRQHQQCFEHLLSQADGVIDFLEHLTAGQHSQRTGLLPEAPDVHRQQNRRYGE